MAGPFEIATDVISSNPFAFGYNLWLNKINQPILDKFRADQEAIADRVVGGVTDAAGRLTSETGAIGAQNLRGAEQLFGFDQPAAFDALQEEAGLFGREIVAMQRAREASILSEIEGLGDAERAGLNRTFDRASRSSAGRLTGFGLGGTSVASSVGTGIERARTQERSALEERLTRERVDTISGLSEDVIGARIAAGELNLGLQRERIGFNQSTFENLAASRDLFGLAGARAQREGALDISDVEGSIDRQPPIIGQQIAFN